MDLLNFVVALHNALGVDIPEADYPQLDSLNASLRYLSEKVGQTT
jgi:acyl carrier protein